MPSLDTCYQVEASRVSPASFATAPPQQHRRDNPDQTTVNWVKEKLLTIDPINHCSAMSSRQQHGVQLLCDHLQSNPDQRRWVPDPVVLRL
ncbi:hypothetical protein CK203_003809 [Vitis vinifera]|uniref:Uncharacterized protein n=1 Tax=Vitis vinifera TaxID=29760 RepID=A0A438K812_VITVI|nr:hypothetical protein CK203_003809 [Vitis vinifera]